MKKICFLLVFLPAVFGLRAQSMPKKYVYLEHFTNTKCPICAGKNPAFYSLINQYPNDVHHLAIHPPVPYNTCVLYKANATENYARALLYSIDGAPRVALNGDLVPVSTPLLPAATLQNALGQTSPIAIRVEEGGSFPTKTATITVTTYGNVPAGSYKLYAAVTERTVNYAAPNGEAKHPDVFRAMLPTISGYDYTPAPKGQSIKFNVTYNYSAPSGWTSNFDSLYILAFVQNVTTNEVLNSGTRFDPVFTGSTEATAPLPVRLQPNPATEEVSVVLSEEQVEQITVFSLSGALQHSSFRQEQGLIRIPVAALAPGIYLVRITTRLGSFIGKFVRA